MLDSIDFSLYLITDRHQVAAGHSLLTAVEAALDGGVRAVQLREKDLPAAELLPLAEQLRTLTRRFGARLLINDRVDVALAVGADGVHLGGHSMPADLVRRLLGPDLLIGVSTHHREEIDRAAVQGADFVTFGPVFATPSKAGYGPPRGLSALTEACRDNKVPVFALGGITPANTDEALMAGADGIALISAILADSDPCAAAKAFTT